MRQVGLLTILGIESSSQYKDKNGKTKYRYVYKARCVCGEYTTIRANRMTGKKLKQSCGKHTRTELEMLRVGTSKGGFQRPEHDTVLELRDFGGNATAHPLYGMWLAMRARCTNPANASYKSYGARGIYVDVFWDDFWAFAATVGERPEKHSLGRIDNNGPYSPENCRWETAEVQAQNRRSIRVGTYGGVTMSVPEWARTWGVRPGSINDMLRIGVPFDVLAKYATGNVDPLDTM